MSISLTPFLSHTHIGGKLYRYKNQLQSLQELTQASCKHTLQYKSPVVRVVWQSVQFFNRKIDIDVVALKNKQ